MSTTTIDALNEEFSLGDPLEFNAGSGDLTFVEIENNQSCATICLQGAQILHWQKHDEPPVLWLSEQARFESGKAIRGGIPICWPWFGNHPDDPEKPAHGFVRNISWKVLATEAISEDKTRIQLGTSDTPETRQLWPFSFRVKVTITVGEELTVELKAYNETDQPYTFGGALHSYFTVSDVSDIKISGLEDTEYVDKLDGLAVKTQQGAICIDREIDAVFMETKAECVIEDSGLKRRIYVAKKGSKSTVVWNPWIEKTKQLADVADEGYQTMVCIEAANTGEDLITVPAFGSRILKTTLRTETL